MNMKSSVDSNDLSSLSNQSSFSLPQNIRIAVSNCSRKVSHMLASKSTSNALQLLLEAFKQKLIAISQLHVSDYDAVRQNLDYFQKVAFTSSLKLERAT